jgi:hypothetical protein
MAFCKSLFRARSLSLSSPCRFRARRRRQRAVVRLSFARSLNRPDKTKSLSWRFYYQFFANAFIPFRSTFSFFFDRFREHTQQPPAGVPRVSKDQESLSLLPLDTNNRAPSRTPHSRPSRSGALARRSIGSRRCFWRRLSRAEAAPRRRRVAHQTKRQTTKRAKRAAADHNRTKKKR